MKIVVVDAHALNPGDLSWKLLEELGDCTIYPRTPPEAVVERCREADAVVTNKVLFEADRLQQLPRLRYLGVTATGYNIVDVAAAREQNIIVTNVPAYSTDSVAQAVFAHLFNLTLNTEYHAQTVSAGRWSQCPDFCYWDRPLIEVAGLTMGIVGLGRIGRAVARAAAAFGMKVLAHNRSPAPEPPEGTQMTPLDDLLAQSDVVTLHCPLTLETRNLIDARRLNLMKPTAYLINVSRGGLVDEIALAEALNAGRLAGAGLDVLSVEPPPPDHPLLSAARCRITPHIAWCTVAARQRLLDQTIENVRAFLAGRPINVVS